MRPAGRTCLRVILNEEQLRLPPFWVHVHFVLTNQLRFSMRSVRNSRESVEDECCQLTVNRTPTGLLALTVSVFALLWY